jgi:transposase-like protein
MIAATEVARMKKSKRSYWTAAQAGAVLDRIERSGLSISRFAFKHSLAVERLYRWKRRLAQERRDPETSPRFAEVTIRPSAVAGSIEIELSGGVFLRVAGDTRVDDAVAVLSRLPVR